MDSVNKHMPQAPLRGFLDSPTLTLWSKYSFFIYSIRLLSSPAGVQIAMTFWLHICYHPFWVDREIQFSYLWAKMYSTILLWERSTTMVKTGSEMRVQSKADVCDLILDFILSHTCIFRIQQIIWTLTKTRTIEPNFWVCDLV